LQDHRFFCRYSHWLVLEYVEQAQFRVIDTSTGIDRSSDVFLKEMDATFDRSDSWNVLQALREASRYPEEARTHSEIADSIDAALAKNEIMRRDLGKWHRRGKPPDRFQKEQEPRRKSSEPPIMIVPVMEDSDSFDKDFERMEKEMEREVWDYAGGKRL